MKDILKEKNIEIKINTRKFYLRVLISNNENIFDTIAKYASDGIGIIEINGKNISDKLFLEYAKKIQLICAQFDTTFIISSRADIAFLLNADGICIYNDDIDEKYASEILHPNCIIGRNNPDLQECDYLILDSIPENGCKMHYFVKSNEFKLNSTQLTLYSQP